MKKPAIVSLSSVQRQEVVNTLDEILKESASFGETEERYLYEVDKAKVCRLLKK